VIRLLGRVASSGKNEGFPV